MDQRDLVRCIRKYRTYDNELKALNTQTHKLRENKKIVEMEICLLYTSDAADE